MIIIIMLSIIIVFVILLLCVVTTSKAYDYKHTVDPLTKKQHEKK
ncbi:MULTISPECIES: YtzI protein [Priestia]|nr:MULTISPECIES: YtzI protein [Priestia]MBY0007543.1 YtzI protein [Priestia aryabhattai]MBY0045068.1 YtzI protein [Priestia aryabhattai]MED3951242.1 YtzI protein [Priestia aryabhattai]WDC89896.1 YtzI protein [Priestia megaterium]